MFWENAWLGDLPLAQQYPSLFYIVHWKDVLVAQVMGAGSYKYSF
jgi:hypothetical protein